MSPAFEETAYGFKWGAADVCRIASVDKRGWVVIGVTTPRHRLELYVTKTGMIRVSVDGERMVMMTEKDNEANWTSIEKVEAGLDKIRELLS